MSMMCSDYFSEEITQWPVVKSQIKKQILSKLFELFRSFLKNKNGYSGRFFLNTEIY